MKKSFLSICFIILLCSCGRNKECNKVDFLVDLNGDGQREMIFKESQIIWGEGFVGSIVSLRAQFGNKKPVFIWSFESSIPDSIYFVDLDDDNDLDLFFKEKGSSWGYEVENLGERFASQRVSFPRDSVTSGDEDVFSALLGSAFLFLLLK
jgi:hypothetical protein